ncbi:MAG: DUF2270 domain-containing protein [Anaerolineae bacterium]|nr:DUF2270 domain-containing protein [Anaerolineae bacterium]
MSTSHECKEPVWTYQGYELDKGNFTTAMVHFYRAEVTRVNLWRNRLDTTTNWAVVTTAGALTFGFSSAQNPHFVMLLVLALVLVFLNIEARRYTYYSLWYHRVRLFETNFFAAMLAPPFQPAADWGDTLSDTLMNPRFPISHWEAIGNRFRRNYAPLITLILTSWFLKLAVHPTPTANFHEIMNRASIGHPFPGPLVMGTITVIYLLLNIFTMVGYARYLKRGAPPRSEWQKHGPSWFKPQQTPSLALIITNRKEEVSTRLMNELGRGVTALEGVGMYTGEKRAVLLCVTTDVQVSHLKSIVHEIDKSGFVIFTQAEEVRGGQFQTQEPP